MYLPGTPEEAYEFTMDAFDLAEFAQTPVFVLTDLDLGMNNWMCDPFAYPEKPISRGKVLTAEEFEKVKTTWGRYADPDGDGVPWRTLPGTEADGMSYFTRGSGHDEKARYTEDGDTYVRNMERLTRKFETVRQRLPAPILSPAGRKTPVGLIAFGTTHWAIEESRHILRENHGVDFDYLRVRAFPFADAVAEFLAAHDRVYVVEQNRDGQMALLMRMDYPQHATHLRSILRFDGLPLDAEELAVAIAEHESGETEVSQ